MEEKTNNIPETPAEMVAAATADVLAERPLSPLEVPAPAPKATAEETPVPPVQNTTVPPVQPPIPPVPPTQPPVYGQQPPAPNGMPPFGQNPVYGQQPPAHNGMPPFGQNPMYGQQTPFGQPYGVPYYPQAPKPAKKNTGMAIASMVLGILSIVIGCCCTYLGIPLSITAFVLALVDRAKSPEKKFSGMALAGFILGIIGFALCVLDLILFYSGVLDFEFVLPGEDFSQGM